jgi:serine/threonine protein kinase/cytochrome c-type biogenesis protein CcmH/NrfG
MVSEDIIVENYRLISRLGSGSFGNVYLAQHIFLTNRIVAIKVMHLNHVENLEEVVQFLTEPQILEKLRHPFILPIINAGIYNGLPYQITEYASGGSLRARLQQQPTKPFQLAEIITILTQVGQALQFAHEQNIIHRDLKPENILFNEKGHAILADFGIATTLSTTSVKQTNANGTFPYMAPEEFQDVVCKESDQYSLGCIAYELLTGQIPFQASNPASIIAKLLYEAPISARYFNPHLPEHIEVAILKALAKQRSDRHSNVSAFITALIKPTNSLHQNIEEEKRWIGEEKSTTAELAIALYEKGLNLAQHGQHQEALVTFERCIKLDSKFAYAHYGKGNALKALGYYENALTSLSLAIQFDSSHVSFYHSKGDVFYILERYDEALYAYDCIVQIDPSDAYAYYRRGCILRILERLQEALVAFEHTLKRVPDFVPAYLEEGYILYKLHYYEASLNAYRQAIRLDGNNAQVYIEVSLVLGHMEQYNEALQSIENALRLQPSSANAWGCKALILSSLGIDREALDAYDTAIHLDPNHRYLFLNKAILLERLNCYAEALLTIEEALRINSNDSELHLKKGYLLISMSEFNSAVITFNDVIQIDSQNSSAYLGLGLALEQLLYHQNALNVLEKALTLDPNNPLAWYIKSLALMGLGQTFEAQLAYKVSLSLSKSKSNNNYV